MNENQGLQAQNETLQVQNENLQAQMSSQVNGSTSLIHIVVICCIAVSVRRLMRCCFSFRLPMSPILRRYRSCKTFLFTFADVVNVSGMIIPSLWTLPTLPLFSPVCLKRSCRERAWRILWTLKGAVEPVEKLTCRYREECFFSSSFFFYSCLY